MTGQTATANAIRDHPNTSTAGVLGAISILALYIAGEFGWHPPPEVSAAVTTIITTAGVELRARVAIVIRNGHNGSH